MTDRLREAAQAALDDLEARCGTNAPERGPDGSITKLRAALAEQTVKESLTIAEPVAWMDIDSDGTRHGVRMWAEHGRDEVPLYTHPPRREWAGLTKEERRGILDTTHPDSRWTLVERVEAALRAKNDPR